jgi:hypothetical protein
MSGQIAVPKTLTVAATLITLKILLREDVMKPFAVNLISSMLAFACGFATASSSHRSAARVIYQSDPDVLSPPPSTPQFSVSTSIPSHEAIRFGDGLTIVTNEVKLKSERLRYNIDVRYPQIIGTDDVQIAQLNERIKNLTSREYERPLYPTQAELHYFQMQQPSGFNLVNMDYEIGIATRSFLSIYFQFNNYSITSAHWSQYGLTFNYDLSSKKELKLSDIFKPGSKYLEFISDYCQIELSSKGSEAILYSGLMPEARNFERWLITSNGIRFKFDECKVYRCAAGAQTVQIPFAAMDHLLNPGLHEKGQVSAL